MRKTGIILLIACLLTIFCQIEDSISQEIDTKNGWKPKEGLELIGTKAPSLDGLKWLNTKPLDIEDLRGKVVLVRFWLVGCPLCENTAPALGELYSKYRDEGFIVIGIHHHKSERTKDPGRLPENFSKAMKSLAEKNPELKDVFENVDFVQFTANRENAELLRQLVELFSAKPLHDVSPDILRDAYEWILRYFAPQKAKEGEIYTPREVIKLIVEILNPKSGESVYDPACGSGGMLISSYQHAESENGKSEADRLFLFGQEANHKTLALAKMNLYIHDIRNAQLTLGDTLLYPKFKDGERIRKFDVVIANPPWNQDGYNEVILKKGEFWKERLKFSFPPKQSADWAWIEHMLASADDETGRVGVVIDNGCLFRGGKEKIIRAGVVNADLIEAIILLPEKLFYNTGAPGAIVILNKNKPEERKGKVLFINASKEYQQHSEVRKLNQLGDEHIEKIAEVYREFKDTDGFSKAIDLEKIKENDYNLNVTLYVFPEEETEKIDLAEEWKDLRGIEKELVEIERRIEGYLRELKESSGV